MITHNKMNKMAKKCFECGSDKTCHNRTSYMLHKPYVKRYYEAHKEHIRTYARAWRGRNPGYMKAWNTRNPDYDKTWYLLNRNHVSERSRKRFQKRKAFK